MFPGIAAYGRLRMRNPEFRVAADGVLPWGEGVRRNRIPIEVWPCEEPEGVAPARMRSGELKMASNGIT